MRQTRAPHPEICPKCLEKRQQTKRGDWRCASCEAAARKTKREQGLPLQQKGSSPEICTTCLQPKRQNARGQWRCDPCAIAARNLTARLRAEQSLPVCPGRIPKEAEIVIRVRQETGGYAEYALGLADLAASIGRTVLRCVQAQPKESQQHPVMRIDRVLQEFNDRTTEVTLMESGKAALQETKPEIQPQPVCISNPVFISENASPVPWNSPQLKAAFAVALQSERLTRDGVIAIVHGKKDGCYSAKRPVALDPYETAVVVLTRVGTGDAARWKATAGKDERPHEVWATGGCVLWVD